MATCCTLLVTTFCILRVLKQGPVYVRRELVGTLVRNPSRRGLIHKDIKPANVLVSSATDQVSSY
jgi:serine/threonine protein kinase